MLQVKLVLTQGSGKKIDEKYLIKTTPSQFRKINITP